MNPYAFRRYIIIGIFGVTMLVYLMRLFYLQIVDVSYKYSADNNSRRYVTQYPARGIVYDRNGKMVVYNEAAYDLMVSPLQLKPFDTADFCRILNITHKFVRENIRSSKRYSIYKPSVFLKQLSAENYALLEEKLYKFPGFFVQTRTLRKYKRKIAAHLLGYVGEVDEKDIDKDPYYKMGDYIGISGLEKYYEKQLRGEKGVNIYLVDVHNRIKGAFQNGKYDTTAVVGRDLTCTIDADLQEYAEHLMQNMSGSVVAIEPATGEILAMVSAPTYDPGLLVGRERAANYVSMLRDPLKPLFNRAVMAKYPPGSTYKLVNSLIGLKEGVLKTETRYGCSMGFHAGNLKVGCHNHPSPLNLTGAIAISCNGYFCNVFRSIIDNKDFNSVEESYMTWYNYAQSMGLGHKLNTDIPQELPGYIPSAEYYDKYHGRNRWKALSIISLAIGQGELGITVLQMANVAATVANRGYYYTPHLVKKIKGEADIDPRFKEKIQTPFDTATYGIVVEGMYQAVHGYGTAGGVRLNDVAVCGKTGTAENPHGLDHSIFICFAPKTNPKIAMAVYVENAGFGATWAVPLARLMIEKYLHKPISRPELEDHLLSYERKPWLKPKKKIATSIDWTVVGIWLILVIMGWLNIYAAVYNEEHSSIFDFGMKYGTQLILIGSAILIAAVILLIDLKVFSLFAFVIYGITIILLMLVLVAGHEVNGNKAWLAIGKFTIQPAEFAKVGAALAISKYFSMTNVKVTELKSLFIILGILGLPMLLILLQPDVGSLLVYLSFSIVLFREGLPGGFLLFGFALGVLFFLSLLVSKVSIAIGVVVIGFVAFAAYTRRFKETAIGVAAFGIAMLLVWIGMLIMGKPIDYYFLIAIAFTISGFGFLIYSFFRKVRFLVAFVLFMIGSLAFTYSVDFVFHHVLEDHQRSRMNILLGIESDPLGMGYNVNQSLIAVGSGGFLGKGYLQGTQTKYNFVPEQSTDFIFCTIGEEWGFVGTTVVLGLFLFLMIRIVNIAERQRSIFSRVFAYCVASIMFFHIAINVGMAIGLLPVIGIPLPFFSYGGSSLWSFTVLVFIVVRLDANRTELLR